MIYNDMRPHRFDDVKGQTLVVENIRNQSKKNRFFPVFILCGQYGSNQCQDRMDLLEEGKNQAVLF